MVIDKRVDQIDVWRPPVVSDLTYSFLCAASSPKESLFVPAFVQGFQTTYTWIMSGKRDAPDKVSVIEASGVLYCFPRPSGRNDTEG